MEMSGAAIWEDLDDDLPCLAREECVRSLLGEEAAAAMNRWPLDLADGDDE